MWQSRTLATAHHHHLTLVASLTSCTQHSTPSKTTVSVFSPRLGEKAIVGVFPAYLICVRVEGGQAAPRANVPNLHTSVRTTVNEIHE